MKKFAEKLYASEERKERRPRKESSNEPKEWVSGSSSATFGDLIKNLDLQLDDAAEEAPAEEEAPKKKTTRKKKTEEAPAEETSAE